MSTLLSNMPFPVLHPSDPGFADAVAPFCAAITPCPELVVPARSANDVAAAVTWAAEQGRRVSIQTTGHQLLNDLAGTVLIRTRNLNRVRIDRAARTATIGGGATFAEVIDAAAPHGLAPLCGSSSHVGVVGFTLGGGHGHLSRRFGLGADHVRSLQLVTADGAVRQVDADHDADLFWAIRGGKAGFGIVTEIKLDLHPVERLYGGGIFFAGSNAAALLHAWREWVTDLPEESTTSIALMRMPDLPSVPTPLRGQCVVSLRYAHLGTEETGSALLAPMRAIAEPLIDGVAEMPFAALDTITRDPTEPVAICDASAPLGVLPADAVDRLLAVAGPNVQVPLITIELRHLGGAIAREPTVPNAAAARGAAFSAYALAPMFGPAAAIAPATTTSVIDALAPWRCAGGIPNFQGLSTKGRLAGLWDPATHKRLIAIRTQHDPDGIFAAGLQIADEPILPGGRM